MTTYTDAAQCELDREFERKEALREERKWLIAPLNAPALVQGPDGRWRGAAEIAATFPFPGDGLALFHPRYGLRLTQEDAKPWVQMDAQTAERFAEWLRGQVRAAEDASVRAERLDVV
jgi:hypothetical protein